MKLIIAGLYAMVALQAAPVSAQLGRLVKEGVEAVGKRAFSGTAKKFSGEGAEQILKKATTVGIRKVGQESAEAMGKGVGVAVIRHSDDAVKVIAKYGSAVGTPIVKNFGDDGAKALMKLSPRSARRMAILSEELASGGRGADWMRILADKGDVAAEWIWKNKGTLVISTAAAAFLANPEPFLYAGEHVASKGIETAGEHVARPLIEQTVSSVAPQVAKHVATTVTRPAVVLAEATGRHPWSAAAFVMILIAIAVMAYRLLIRPWLQPFRKS